MDGGALPDSVYLFDHDGTFEPLSGPLTDVKNTTEGANIDLSRIRVADFNGDGVSDVYRISGWGTTESDKIYLFDTDGRYSEVNGPATEVGNTAEKARIDVSRIIVADMSGDGLTDLVRLNGWGQTAAITVYFSNADLSVTEIDDGVIQHHITTQQLTSISDYDIGADRTYPDINVRPSFRVVTDVTTGNALNESHTTTYQYGELKLHAGGLGLLGFGSIVSTDLDTGISSETRYSQDWQHKTEGMVLSTKVFTSEGIALSESVNQLENRFEGLYDDRFLPYIKSTTTVQRDLDGSVINTTTLEHTLNDDGLVELDVTCISADDLFDGGVLPCQLMPGKEILKNAVYDYYPKSYAPEYRGLLHRKTTSVSVPIAPPFQSANEARVVEYDYYTSTGQVKWEASQPDDSDSWLKKSYTYHSSGQLATTEVSGADIATRTVEVVYDPVSLLPVKKYNELRHMEETRYEDTRFPWMATTIIAPDGAWVKLTYNSWGEKVRTVSGHGSKTFGWSTTDKRWCSGDANCDPENGELFYVVSESVTGTPSYIYFDQLGREVRRQGSGLNDGVVEAIHASTVYNDRGLVSWAGNPHFESDSSEYGVATEYDILGRSVSVIDAAQQESTIEYHGRTVIYTDPKGHKKTVNKNALGQQVSVLDNHNNAITYRYDAFGNMVYMADPFGNETKIGYDIRGFKTRLSDPDQGDWYYSYDALGQMVDQTDAKAQVTHTTYDLLGRMKSRTDLWGTAQANTSNWYYDDTSSSPAAIGKLTHVTNNRNFAQTIHYDSFGRAWETATVIDGVPYTGQMTFDDYSRVLNTVYPTGFTVQNRYHSVLGGLDSIVLPDGDADPSNDYTFWKAQSTDARGQLEQAALGGIISTYRRHNDATGMVDDIRASASWMSSYLYQDITYQWDSAGNLESFNDLRQGVSETYVYDDLDRLNDVIASNGINSSARYDEMGNITSKSGVGSYSYDGVAVPSECGAVNREAGPHAVRRVTGEKANYYCYDANGNLVKDKDRQIQFTSFNKPNQISRGGTVVTFDYGPSRSRFKRKDVKGSTTETTHYLGEYERVVEGSVVKHKITIGGVAQVVKTEGESLVEINYFLKDHMGSITAIVNKYGTVKEEMSFDAWGNRRLTSLDLQSAPLDYENKITKRGFTGHEHIDSVGLIHMNGRVYDPLIGRFLSADPIVQAPSNLQSLNRYSYVLNNPLSLTDPSGYSWMSKKWHQVKDRAKRFATAAVMWAVTGQYFAGEAGYQYRKARDLGMSAADARKFGAKVTAISAASKGLSYWAGDVLGSGQWEAIYGTDYYANFIAEGISRVVVHGTIGGTTAKVSGGNFADGFVVSGFRAGYSFIMGVNFERPGFFALAEHPILAILEQTAVAAAAAKMAGGDTSSAATSELVQTALAAYIFNDNMHLGAQEEVFGKGQAMYMDKNGEMVDSNGTAYRYDSEAGWYSYDGGIETVAPEMYLIGGAGAVRASALGVRAFSSRYVVDGFSKGLRYGEGRVFQIRPIGSAPKFRLDFHSNPSPAKLHMHFGNMEAHRPFYAPWLKY